MNAIYNTNLHHNTADKYKYIMARTICLLRKYSCSSIFILLLCQNRRFSYIFYSSLPPFYTFVAVYTIQYIYTYSTDTKEDYTQRIIYNRKRLRYDGHSASPPQNRRGKTEYLLFDLRSDISRLIFLKEV